MLNNYRVRLLPNAVAVRALAYLCKDGPRTEEELARILGLSTALVRRCTTDLFRANLVAHRGNDRLGATAFATYLLDRFGILTPVVSDIVRSQSKLTDADTLLRAIIEARSAVEDGWTRRMLPYFSCAPKICEADDKGHALQRMLLYLVVLLDSSTRELGASNFYLLVVKHHSTHRTDLWKTHSAILNDNKERYIRWIDGGISDLIESNEWLIHRKQQQSKQAEFVALSSAIRFVGAILAGEADSSLNALIADLDVKDYLWRDSFMRDPKLSRKAVSILKLHGCLSKSRVSNSELSELWFNTLKGAYLTANCDRMLQRALLGSQDTSAIDVKDCDVS